MNDQDLNKGIPRSTYRLQLNGAFTFEDAAKLLPYLKELGISHIYASPILKAGSTSQHGYDVCSHQEIDPKLGGAVGFERFAQELKKNGFGLLLDIVPNHMRADTENQWWFDVLARGPRSPYARYFDFHWQSEENPTLKPCLQPPQECVLLPVLEAPYDKVLEAGKLRLIYENGRLWIAYYENRFPANLETYARILSLLTSALSGEILPGAAHKLSQTNLEDLMTEFRNFHSSNPCVQATLERCLEKINGKPGAPGSFDTLSEILTLQNFRLCWWKIANDEINYRRFFEVNELVCLNVQKPSVFAASHKVIRSLVRRDLQVGLRVDHPDGLSDPERYLRRLKSLFRPSATAPFLLVEKILSQGETLPETWPVAGTTGYDFLVELNGIFIDAVNEAEFTRIYRDFTGCGKDFGKILFECRSRELQNGFNVPLQALAKQLKKMATKTRYARDLTFSSLKVALEIFVSAFPIYRTYITQRTQQPTAQDKWAVEEAARLCRSRAPQVSSQALDFLTQLLLLKFPRDFEEVTRKQAVRFAMKLQQLTSPLAAKGGEDTAYYVYNRLGSLSEVGGNPGVFGCSVEEFHRANQARLVSWPHSQLATATHDTKRGEDVRARLNVLTEIPQEWNKALQRWCALNQAAKNTLNGEPSPSSNDEYLLYQTLIGAWPTEKSPDMRLFVERIVGYMQKAARESKTHTNWINPNPEYEAALEAFIKTVLSDPQNTFLSSFLEFQKRIAFFGCFNSLSQTAIKITAPGVPDVYQGTELWDLSLVDPDNRRPVDYEKRRSLFTKLQGESTCLAREEFLRKLLQEAPGEGAIKLFVTWQFLKARREHEALFAEGEYHPAQVFGSAQRHLCAFLRRHHGKMLLILAPRLPLSLAKGRHAPPLGDSVWTDTRITWPGAQTGQKFRDHLSQLDYVVKSVNDLPSLGVAEVLSSFPLALLENED